jgi:hypothetical protein
MGFGKCCETGGERKQAGIEHLVHRGRLLHDGAVYEAFAKAIVREGECFVGALRMLAAGSRKLKQG